VVVWTRRKKRIASKVRVGVCNTKNVVVTSMLQAKPGSYPGFNVGGKYNLGGKIFILYIKQVFLGTTKFGRYCSRMPCPPWLWAWAIHYKRVLVLTSVSETGQNLKTQVLCN